MMRRQGSRPTPIHEDDCDSSDEYNEENYKKKVEDALESVERGISALSKSGQESLLVTIREDPRLRKKSRDLFLHIARSRSAGQEAAAVSLAAAEVESDEITLREIGIISATAAHLALEESIKAQEEMKNDDTSSLESKNVSLEKFEDASERVLRAELIFAKHLFQAKQNFIFAARQEARETANQIVDALLFGSSSSTRRKRETSKKLISSRPHILEALASGNANEIEAALRILLAPSVVYARHYINLAALWPRIILVIIGSTILVQQGFALQSQACADVLKINGVSFLPLAGWLAAQIFCDILIIMLRFIRYFTLVPLVHVFSKNQGAEAAKIRKDKRHRLFSTFVQHSVARSVALNNRKKVEKKSIVTQTKNYNFFPHRRRFSFRRRQPPQKKKEDDDDDIISNENIDNTFQAREDEAQTLYEEPPHILDAMVPIEEATERGERAMLALARVDSNTIARLLLALLTIFSFVLGLAGGIYLLLPINHNNCQPGLLLLAYGYVAFFYIFFLPNLVVVFVAIAELHQYNHDTLNFELSTNAFSKLDEILFLGQLPVCVFLARTFIFDIYSNVPTTKIQLERSLHRDRSLLAHRRNELHSHLSFCDAQLEQYDHIIKNFQEKEKSCNSFTTPSVRRYTRLIPDIHWQRSFVPVFHSHGSTHNYHKENFDLEAGHHHSPTSTIKTHYKDYMKKKNDIQNNCDYFPKNRPSTQQQQPQRKISDAYSSDDEFDFAFHTTTSSASSPTARRI